MATDLLRVEGNERLDLIDFDFMANTGMQELVTEPIANLMTDPAKQQVWIISGFEMSNPAASQLQVDRGVAMLATREGGVVKYGYLTTLGEASRTVDLSTYSPGTYEIFIRFDYLDGDTSSRIFWNPSGAGGEFSQNVATRRLANWSIRVESSSPGAEWFKIGEVVQTTMAITDQRDFYFEGNIDDSYESGWSTEGGGVANDRNADRATYGVRDFQTFSAAIRQSITDIRGRGLREWYEKGIGGMNIGFDTDPTENILAVSDVGLGFNGVDSNDKYVILSGTGGSILFDRGTNDMYLRTLGVNRLRVNSLGVNVEKGLFVGDTTTAPSDNQLAIVDANNYHTFVGDVAQWSPDVNCTLEYDRSEHSWTINVDSQSYFSLDVANTGVGVRSCELDLFGLSNFTISSDATDAQWEWNPNSLIVFDRTSDRLEFDINTQERFHIDSSGCQVTGDLVTTGDIYSNSGLRIGGGITSPGNGRGIFIVGIAAGFDADPSAGNVEVGDVNFRMDHNSTTPAIYFDSTSAITYHRTANQMYFDINGNRYLDLNEIDANNWSVDLGKSTDQPLAIDFNATANTTTINANNHDLIIQTAEDIFLTSGTSFGEGIYLRNSTPITLGIIDPLNGLILGSTAIPTEQLEVNDNVSNGYVASFRNDGDDANRHGIIIQGGADLGTGVTNYVRCNDGDGDEVGGLRNNVGTFQVYDISDERLKRDIKDTQINGLDVINGLELIEFRWKKHGEDGFLHPIGFRAQQAKKVFPYMVIEDPALNSDILSVSPMLLIGVLCKAIQELTDRVISLEGV